VDGHGSGRGGEGGAGVWVRSKREAEGGGVREFFGCRWSGALGVGFQASGASLSGLAADGILRSSNPAVRQRRDLPAGGCASRRPASVAATMVLIRVSSSHCRGSEGSTEPPIKVTRPYSTTTRTPEPIVNQCSSSDRPDIRKYGTTASGRDAPSDAPRREHDPSAIAEARTPPALTDRSSQQHPKRLRWRSGGRESYGTGQIGH
jgi:hypothetical protein